MPVDVDVVVVVGNPCSTGGYFWGRGPALRQRRGRRAAGRRLDVGLGPRQAHVATTGEAEVVDAVGDQVGVGNPLGFAVLFGGGDGLRRQRRHRERFAREGKIGEGGRTLALCVIEKRVLLADAPTLGKLVVQHVEVAAVLPGEAELVHAVDDAVPPGYLVKGSPGSPSSPSRWPERDGATLTITLMLSLLLQVIT